MKFKPGILLTVDRGERAQRIVAATGIETLPSLQIQALTLTVKGGCLMKIIRRIEITTVTEKTYGVLLRAKSEPESCSRCDNVSPLLAPELIARLTGIALRNLFRWIESGVVHFIEKPDGQVLLCHQSAMGYAVQLESEVVFSNESWTSTTTKRAGK